MILQKALFVTKKKNCISLVSTIPSRRGRFFFISCPPPPPPGTLAFHVWSSHLYSVCTGLVTSFRRIVPMESCPLPFNWPIWLQPIFRGSRGGSEQANHVCPASTNWMDIPEQLTCAAQCLTARPLCMFFILSVHPASLLVTSSRRLPTLSFQLTNCAVARYFFQDGPWTLPQFGEAGEVSGTATHLE